ncbi:MAG: radical SAM protein [Nanoarchaeota archaeon]
MKVLLLNPSSQYSEAVVRDTLYGCWCKGRANYMWPPMGLAYIAAVLEESGFKPDIFDALALGVNYNDMQKEVEQKKPDIIIINTATITFGEDLVTLEKIKEAVPNVKTVMLGTHTSAMPQQCAKEKAIDFLILGEPDYIVRDLVDAIDKGKDLNDVKGIAFERDGKVTITHPAPMIEDLDAMPFPARHLITKEGNYFNPFAKKMPYTTSLSSRGCPFKCIYCSSTTLYGDIYRARSAENVVDEIELIIKQGFKEIFYRDETLTFDKNRTAKICDLIKERNLDISWMCNSRVDTVTPELLIKMKKAGCHMVKYGVESGDQQILNNLVKGTTVEGIRNAFKWTRDAKMSTVAHFMFGSPGETVDSMNKSIALAKEIKTDYASFNITTPYPGTVLFDKYIGKVENWDSWSLKKSLESGQFNEKFSIASKKEIEEAFARAYKEFYYRPSYIAKRLVKSNPSEILRIAKAALPFLKFTRGADSHEREASGDNTGVQ